MQARKGVVFSPRQGVVFSKACVRTWMGEYVFVTCIPSLTLAQAWLRSCIHCQSSHNYYGNVSHLE